MSKWIVVSRVLTMKKRAQDRGKRSKNSELESTTAIYCDLLLGEGGSGLTIACPEQLERSRLDFTLESLHVIDRYLGQVRARQDGLERVIYLNTVVAAACYLGEVIRRGTPGGECHWLRASAATHDDTHTGINLGDFADIMLGAKGADQPLRLTRVVARIASGAAPLASTYEYAVVAMKRIWISATTADR